jgi:DNA-binding transcriptional LysR family regulator
MNVFIAVAEESGFSAAARRLNMSGPAVTRAIANLEKGLGVKLLNRTTRFVRTTDAGLRYLQDAKRIVNDVYLANAAAAGINAEPKGTLTVTAPVLFGKMYVTAGIVSYLNQYPDANVEAIFLDRVVNLIEEGVDVGIRIGELPDSSIRALRVGSVRLVTCASSEYIAQHGIIQHPNELAQHNIIAARGVSSNNDWHFNDKQKDISVKVSPRLKVTSNEAAIEATINHFGISRLLSYQVAPYLANGQLKILLENYEPAPKPIHIVHRESHFASAKVRSFIDLLAQQLRQDKSLN